MGSAEAPSSSYAKEVLLSLGSNAGDRKKFLKNGLDKLCRSGFNLQEVSPTVESPAQLPIDAQAEWNRPYLNLVAIGSTNLDFNSFTDNCKRIQLEIGKPVESKWSPRNLDIDLFCWRDAVNSKQNYHCTRTDFLKRPYVLSPLVHIAPNWHALDGDTALAMSLSDYVEFHIPQWMGIVNLTPDSFSDGGKYRDLDDLEQSVKRMIECGVNIIDIGAESTRPNAEPLTDSEEWQRLKLPLERIIEICRCADLGPKVSVDTYHPLTAERALERDVDIINDVTGLGNPDMIELARESGKHFIAMHSLTVPVDPSVGVGSGVDVCEVFEQWVQERQRLWESKGLDLNQVIIDPGIGFGKNSLQSLQLMRSVARFRRLGHRVLVGHSRKRFMRSFARQIGNSFDIETIGATLGLCAQSVDIIRVHDVESHLRAYLSYAHTLSNRSEA